MSNVLLSSIPSELFDSEGAESNQILNILHKMEAVERASLHDEQTDEHICI